MPVADDRPHPDTSEPDPNIDTDSYEHASSLGNTHTDRDVDLDSGIVFDPDADSLSYLH